MFYNSRNTNASFFVNESDLFGLRTSQCVHIGVEYSILILVWVLFHIDTFIFVETDKFH